MSKRAGERKAKKAKTPAPSAPSSGVLAQRAVVRADRLTLERALVELVEDGTVRYAQLEALGIGGVSAAAVAAASVTATAALTSTGGMGALERLDGEMLLGVAAWSGTAAVFALSEVCRGLCALRREPRAWTALDVGALAGLTSCGLRRLPTSVPTANVRHLTLRSEEGKKDFTSAEWVAFLKRLGCAASLRTLVLASKKFGGASNTLRAVEPLVANVETLVVAGVAEASVDAFLRVLRAAPALRDLEVETSHGVRWDHFLERLAQLAALQRGAGAKSLLTRIVRVGFAYGPGVRTTFALQLATRLFPELRELGLRGVNACAGDPAPPAPLSVLRVLRLRDVSFTLGAAVAHYAAGEPMSEDALSAYVFDVERTCPRLEVWETKRAREYLSTKDLKKGMRFQPRPRLRGIAGAAFPRLAELALDDFRVDAESFAGVDVPKLARLRLLCTQHTHEEQRDTYRSFKKDTRTPAWARGAPDRAAVSRPLETSAEATVKVTWLTPSQALYPKDC